MVIFHFLMEMFLAPLPMMYTAAFQIFIDSDFVIIIYIPYTCLSVCNKPMLSLRYDLFLLLYARHI